MFVLKSNLSQDVLRSRIPENKWNFALTSGYLHCTASDENIAPVAAWFSSLQDSHLIAQASGWQIFNFFSAQHSHSEACSKALRAGYSYTNKQQQATISQPLTQASLSQVHLYHEEIEASRPVVPPSDQGVHPAVGLQVREQAARALVADEVGQVLPRLKKHTWKSDGLLCKYTWRYGGHVNAQVKMWLLLGKNKNWWLLCTS